MGILNECKGFGRGGGKIILLGEHSVVYGRPALAVGLPDGVTAKVAPSARKVGQIRCRDWRMEIPLNSGDRSAEAVRRILRRMGEAGLAWEVDLEVQIPHSAGLGSSAALCVAVARAFGELRGRRLTDGEAAEVAYEGERSFHGTPSGIDNTVAAYGGLVWFRKGEACRRLELPVALHLAVGVTGLGSDTSEQVGLVRRAWERDRARFEGLFDELGELVRLGRAALAAGDIEALGKLMDRGHELLGRLGVSGPALDEIVSAARASGALGAKLTGAGGGGCAVALCGSEEGARRVEEALKKAGFVAFRRRIRPGGADGEEGL